MLLMNGHDCAIFSLIYSGSHNWKSNCCLCDTRAMTSRSALSFSHNWQKNISCSKNNDSSLWGINQRL
jgi:hypothetical protein